MPKSDAVASRVARLAVLKRFYPSDSEQVENADRDLRVQLLTEAITKTLDADPPLTTEQRVGLAERLMPGPARDLYHVKREKAERLRMRAADIEAELASDPGLGLAQ